MQIVYYEKPYFFLLVASLAVFSVSCTKNNPERHTVEAAVYCNAPATDEDPFNCTMNLYLVPKKESILVDETEPLFANLSQYDFKITLWTKDSTNDIFNQSYSVGNSNKLHPESLAPGRAEVYWNTKSGAFASGGTVTIGTNTIILKAMFPVKGWVEVSFEGEIVRYLSIM